MLDDAGNTFPVSGAECVFAPLGGVIAMGTTVTCVADGLNIPVTAGTRLFVAVSATSPNIATLTGPASVTVEMR